MAVAIIKPTLISSPSNPSIQFTDRFPLTRFKPSSSRPRSVAVKCDNLSNNSSEENGSSLKDLLSAMVGRSVTEMLNKQENRVLLAGLDQAEQNVERVKRELAQLEIQEIEVKKMKEYVSRMESQASEIEECQKEIAEAKAMVEEAKRVLNNDSIGDRDAVTEEERKAIIKNEERFESIKAASVAAVVGTLAGLPFTLAQVTNNAQQVIVTSAITFISCALFGVTFRYVIRRDLDDSHLKTGAAAAFGVVKGLAMLDGGPPLALDVDSLSSHALTAAVNVSENLLVFLFASVGLKYFIKSGYLSPFPIVKPASNKLER